MGGTLSNMTAVLVRGKNMDWLPHSCPLLGIEPGDLLVHERTLNQLSHTVLA